MLNETISETPVVDDEFDLDIQIFPTIDTELPEVYGTGSCDCPAPKWTEDGSTCQPSCPETCGGTCTCNIECENFAE